MKKIILGVAVCILAISLGGCLEEGSYDSVQTTSSIESFVESTTTIDEETTITNEVTTTAEISSTESAAKSTTTTTTKAKTTSKTTTTSTKKATSVHSTYVLNTNTRKFHRIGCHHVAKIDTENRQDFVGSRQQVINMEYAPCGTCKP